MASPLELFKDPLVVMLLAVGIFVGRVVFLAKRLKSAARHATLVDLRALEDAKRSLDAHRASLDAAKHELDANIEGARDTLREYKRPLSKAMRGRRSSLEDEMRSLDHFDAPLEAARATGRRTLKAAKEQTAFNEVRPGKGRRTKPSSNDM